MFEKKSKSTDLNNDDLGVFRPAKGTRKVIIGDGVKFKGEILPNARMVKYHIHLKRIIERKLVMGIADGVVSVDEKEIYNAKDLRVGLFTNTESF